VHTACTAEQHIISKRKRRSGFPFFDGVRTDGVLVRGAVVVVNIL